MPRKKIAKEQTKRKYTKKHKLLKPVVIDSADILEQPIQDDTESTKKELTQIEKEAVRRRLYIDLYGTNYPTHKDKALSILKERMK